MEKFSNVELECSKKPNFIKFTTVDVWKTFVQFTIKMEKNFKCGTQMFHPKPYNAMAQNMNFSQHQH